MLPEDPDSQARFFYLSLLGVAVAFWVFQHYRSRIGQAAQHFAIWGLIFAGVVLAISFFEPLKRSLINELPVQVDENTVAFERGSDGHFYATLQLNGNDVTFMVDTGATAMVLSVEDARSAGIDTSGLSYILPTQTANGQVMSAPVRVDEVALGPFRDQSVRAVVNGGELNQSLLGMSYLDRFSGFRSDGDRFYLTR